MNSLIRGENRGTRHGLEFTAALAPVATKKPALPEWETPVTSPQQIITSEHIDDHIDTPIRRQTAHGRLAENAVTGDQRC